MPEYASMQITLKSGRHYKGEIDMGLADEDFRGERLLSSSRR